MVGERVNVKHVNKNDHYIESHFIKYLLNEFYNLHVCKPWRAYGKLLDTCNVYRESDECKSLSYGQHSRFIPTKLPF